MAGAVQGEDAGPLVRFLRWCGMALVVAGPLIVLATLLHPSRETAESIFASEVRLIASHSLFTLYSLLVLLGLPGLYAAKRGGMGRLGLAGFLTAFSGTYLIPLTGYFGFLAPVLALQSPNVLDAITQYGPVVVTIGLAAICFIAGYAIFGIAMAKTVTLPRLSGVLVAVGGPAHLLGWGVFAAGFNGCTGGRNPWCPQSRGVGVAWLSPLAGPAASRQRPVATRAPAL